MRSCLSSIKNHTTIGYRIYIAYNGSDQDKMNELAKFIKKHFTQDQIHFIKYGYYNFAKLNNDVIFRHLHDDIDTIVFCNNDVKLMSPCVDEIVKCIRENQNIVGTVGCRLLFENGLIQHDGQFLLADKHTNNFIGVTHINLKSDPKTTAPRTQNQTVIGNTFALCGISRKILETIPGLNEYYQYCFEDVEFNLQCLLNFRQNITLPTNIWAYHYESITRSTVEDDSNKFMSDIRNLARFVGKNFPNGHPQFYKQ
jgi:GT2 family glycosyltransferase